MPELRPAVYSLIDRDISRALSTIEQVTPEQVPRKDGARVPENSVTEFTPAQEKAIQDALKGKEIPHGTPVSLHDAIVKDYTGRTPAAQASTLIITHLNADRRALNGLIHDARVQNGEVSKEEVTLSVLVTSNIRDGELRKLSTGSEHQGQWLFWITPTSGLRASIRRTSSSPLRTMRVTFVFSLSPGGLSGGRHALSPGAHHRLTG